jgi:hypothetical protein
MAPASTSKATPTPPPPSPPPPNLGGLEVLEEPQLLGHQHQQRAPLAVAPARGAAHPAGRDGARGSAVCGALRAAERAGGAAKLRCHRAPPVPHPSPPPTCGYTPWGHRGGRTAGSSRPRGCRGRARRRRCTAGCPCRPGQGEAGRRRRRRQRVSGGGSCGTTAGCFRSTRAPSPRKALAAGAPSPRRAPHLAELKERGRALLLLLLAVDVLDRDVDVVEQLGMVLDAGTGREEHHDLRPGGEARGGKRAGGNPWAGAGGARPRP